MIIFIVLVIITIGFFTEAIHEEIKWREQRDALNRMIDSDCEYLEQRYGITVTNKNK